MAKPVTEKLDFLFSTILSPDGDEYTYKEVAEGTKGVVSTSYVWNLRKGKKRNPSRDKIEALARFFNVSPSCFFDEVDIKKTLRLDERILEAINDPKIREIALRALDLNKKSKEFILAMVRKAKELAEEE